MMSSNAKNKRKKTAPYTEETLQKALAEVRDKKKGISAVCRDYGIPKTTVLDRISGRTTDSLKKRGPDPVLGREGEAKVVKWLLDIAKCGFPVKKQELLDVIQKIVKDDGIKNNFKDDRPGQKWFQQFLERNKEISIKNAEGINKARAVVTEESIRLWFKDLENYLDSIGQKQILEDPRRIYNGDESGFALCPKTGKVVGPRGYRNLYQIKQGNEKENITVLLTFNANGDMCPPCVVFPYIRPPKAVVDSMPPDWCLGRSETGWMRGDVFFEYITNDLNEWIVQNNIPKPILLLVDGHKSHMSFMLSTLCEELQIILYALPPNTTHILQPADVSVFAPVKSYWKKSVRDFLSKPENFNSAVTKTNFCHLLSDTLNHPSMPDNIKNGFRRCGLYPFDPNGPDYTKCVRNTLENMTIERRKTSTDINYADIASTKRVFKKLKPILKQKKINVKVIMKEINILKKSLPVEKIGLDPEISIETESEANESSLIDTLNAENIMDMDTTNTTRPVECEMDVTAEISISSLKGDNEDHNKHDQQRNDYDKSWPSLITETVSALVHTSPKRVEDLLPKKNTNAKDKETKDSTTLYNNFDEILTYSETIQNDSVADTLQDVCMPLSSTVIFEGEENIDSLSTLHLSGSYFDVGSVVSLDDVLILPFPDIVCPSQSAETSKYAEETRPTATATSNVDAFKNHLMLPEVIEKNTKKKERTPAAISSAAWRKYYEDKENKINEKKESTRKRKLERIDKREKERVLKENAKANKAPPKRRRKITKRSLQNEACDKSKDSKIKCSECDTTLISDVEDDAEKNLGCDKCLRWYHLKCTPFEGQEYVEVKDKSFKCYLCD